MLFSAMTLQSHAQAYAEFTFDHEKDILGQFMVMEGVPVPGVSATFYPTWYYTTFHKGYMGYALENNKQLLRIKATTDMEKEVEFSDSISRHLKQRAVKEAKSMVERRTDISIGMERSRIQGKLDIFQKNISHIVAYGGTDKDYQYWKSLYSCFVKGVECIHKAYLGNGQRLEEYKAIYSDIIRHNTALVRQLAVWNKYKTSSELLSRINNSKPLRQPSKRVLIATDCKNNWDVIWGIDGFHNSNDD